MVGCGDVLGLYEGHGLRMYENGLGLDGNWHVLQAFAINFMAIYLSADSSL